MAPTGPRWRILIAPLLTSSIAIACRLPAQKASRRESGDHAKNANGPTWPGASNSRRPEPSVWTIVTSDGLAGDVTTASCFPSGENAGDLAWSPAGAAGFDTPSDTLAV